MLGRGKDLDVGGGERALMLGRGDGLDVGEGRG